MHANVVVVASPGRLPRIEARDGLAGRCTGPDTVHLISTAATPLGGDTLTVRLVVEAGARLRIRTAAATMVLPGGHTLQSAAQWELEVAGQLDLDPQPTVVAGGSVHHTTTQLRLAEPAQVRIRSGSRSADPMSETGSGRRHCTRTSTRWRVRGRCCVIASNSAVGPWATMRWPRPGPVSANCAIPHRRSRLTEPCWSWPAAAAWPPGRVTGCHLRQHRVQRPQEAAFSVSCTEAAISSSSSILVRA